MGSGHTSWQSTEPGQPIFERGSRASPCASFRDDAEIAIAALGAEANYLVPIGALGPFSHWLGWPGWMRDGTGLAGSGRLPNMVRMRDDLIILANMLDRGFGPFLLEQTLATDRLITGPNVALIIRNAPTLHEALSTLCLAISATNHNFRMTCRIVDSTMRIEFEETVPLGSLMGFVAAVRVVLVQRTVERFLLESVQLLDLDLSIDDGPLGDLMRINVCKRVRLGAKVNALAIPASWGAQKNPDHDPSLWRLATKRVGRMVQSVEHRDLATRLRQRVATSLSMESRVPRLKELAREMGVSERTLGRKLAGLGIQFQDMVDEERQALVKKLVGDQQLSFVEIADLTGFANASSFSRSFKSWFGTTPTAYRA